MTIKKALDCLEKIVDRAYDSHTLIQCTDEYENEAVETVRNFLCDLIDDLTMNEN